MAAPTVTDITPTTGKAGEQLVITGTNLDIVYKVVFNGDAEAEIIEQSSTEITVEIPYGGEDGVIVVTNVDGEVSSASFTYEMVADGDWNISTEGSGGDWNITTEASDGVWNLTTEGEDGDWGITTEAGDGGWNIETEGENGDWGITTVAQNIIYTGDLEILYEPSTGILTIEDITTWGSGGKPARPTQLLLSMFGTINGSVLSLTPDDEPENVTTWTLNQIPDGVYRITLRDQAGNILRSLLYSVNDLGNKVQNEMSVFIADQIKCNKTEYSMDEYEHLRAMNQALSEACVVDYLVEAQVIFKESQHIAKQCNLKHQLNAC